MVIMNRASFIAATGVALAAVPQGAHGDAATAVAGIRVPSSALAREAESIARNALPASIFNHAFRTYLFAALIAKSKGIAYNPEIVYVASILHDCGLAPAHMSDRNRFEVDGALVARELLSRHAVPDREKDLIWDAITLHDSSGLARWKAHEVALVNAGVGADFGGSLDLLNRDDVIDVLKAAPRTGFVDEFLAAVAVVAKRKPFATGNCFVTDVGYRMVSGFHLPNFCDEVRDDPFARYES